MANEYEVKFVRYRAGHRIEFRETATGDFYASVSKGKIYICDGEWPAEVIDYVERFMKKYFNY